MSRGPGDLLIRVVMGVTVAGMAFAVVALLPLVSGVTLPSQLWAMSMLTGVGFGMVLVGLARNGRRRARAQVSARPSLD